jgi:predicted RNA-binding Zn-ribbon protein involved in translation (DUF1610 family)
MNIKMKVVALPGKEFRAKNSREDIPIIIGKGDTNYLCGNCENILCKNVNVDQISGFHLICPKCGWENEFR